MVSKVPYSQSPFCFGQLDSSKVSIGKCQKLGVSWSAVLGRGRDVILVARLIVSALEDLCVNLARLLALDNESPLMIQRQDS